MRLHISHSALACSVVLFVGMGQCAKSSAATCCGGLEAVGLGHLILRPDTAAYDESEASIWSKSNQLAPWCVFQPTTTDEVSLGVQALVATASCEFAIRSGGHGPGRGEMNNIAAGVRIDLAKMASIVYHAENSSASIQPGATWDRVYETLDAMGIGVLGGRTAGVGVGGLTTGGGLSFYSNDRGMVCDQVLRFEVVLADGRIVEADKDQHSDLWRALKGGSNNFGVVTRLDFETFPTTKIWGGVVTYATSATDALVDALANFVDNLSNTRDSSVLLFFAFVEEIQKQVVFSALENVAGIENSPSHHEFVEVDGILDNTMRMTNMTDLTREIAMPLGFDNIWFTLNLKNDRDVLAKTVELHDNLVEEMKALTGGHFRSMSVLQPFSLTLAEQAAARGGNFLGLERMTENEILYLVYVLVPNRDHAAIANDKIRAVGEAMTAYAKSRDALVDFRYLNYANVSQDVFASYGAEGFSKLQAVAAKYDPDGIFQTRVPGGYKLSKSSAQKVRDEL